MGFKVSGSSGKQKYAKGVYLDVVTVKDVVFEPNPFPNSSYSPPDIAYKVTFDIGTEFNPTDIIAGNFKKDEVSGEITGLSSAFKVTDFFSKATGLYEFELTDDGKVPDSIIKSAIGQSVYRLSYVYGVNPQNEKKKYKNYGMYGDTNADKDVLYQKFLNDVDKGYVKDFTPEVYDESSAPVLPNAFPDEYPPF